MNLLTSSRSKLAAMGQAVDFVTFSFDLTGIRILFIIKDIEIKKCFDEEEYVIGPKRENVHRLKDIRAAL